jgi:hypothetical protein
LIDKYIDENLKSIKSKWIGYIRRHVHHTYLFDTQCIWLYKYEDKDMMQMKLNQRLLEGNMPNSIGTFYHESAFSVWIKWVKTIYSAGWWENKLWTSLISLSIFFKITCVNCIVFT